MYMIGPGLYISVSSALICLMHHYSLLPVFREGYVPSVGPVWRPGFAACAVLRKEHAGGPPALQAAEAVQWRGAAE